MRILVTRPQRQGAETAAKLRALGHEPVLLPLSRPIHDRDALLSGLRQPHQGLIMTSAEAAYGLDAPDWLPFSHETAYAVGEATARTLRAVGFHTIVTGGGSGAELAERIIAAGGHRTLPLLYLAGVPRSADLENKLRHARIPLLVVESYRMEGIDYDLPTFENLFGPDMPTVVLFYSAESIRRFLALSAVRARPALLQGLRMLCLGPKIADALPAFHRETAMIATSPDEDRLLSLI